ncbi:MAG: sugar ABC transporter permease [Clostridia bacterium]|nr:sugar ABC transporter permease [Clostridia bacterium]
MKTKPIAAKAGVQQKSVASRFVTAIKKYYVLYLLLAPALLLTLYFSYLPMPGIIVAFMDYDVFDGFASPWVGFENFKQIFTLPMFTKSMAHTLLLSALNLLIVQPAPLVFALLLNEIHANKFKRVLQTVSYLPHFLSWIAVIGMANAIFSTYGTINDIRVALFGEGTERIRFLASQGFFVPNVLILTVWKSIGWASIIYLASITGIDPQLYEAAYVDGANRFKQCIHITIPSVLPTAIMIFIIQIGQIFHDNFDLVYGLQNPYIDFETVSTVVYKEGISAGNYSVATALGLFQGLVSFILVRSVNAFSRKVNDVALW